jgi:undecaprenyl-phosphate glucose phosphotransferase
MSQNRFGFLMINERLQKASMDGNKGFIHQHSSLLEHFYRGMDVIVVTGCFFLIKNLSPFPWHLQDFFVACSAAGFFYFCAELSGLYRSWRGAEMRQLNLRILVAWAGTALGFLLLIYMSHAADFFPRRVILLWLVVTPVVLLLWRFGMEEFFIFLRRRGRNLRTVAIAGAGDLGGRLGHEIVGSSTFGLHLVGYYDDDKPVGYQPVDQSKRKGAERGTEKSVSVPGVIGNLAELVEQAKSGDVDYIYVTLPMRAENRIRQLVRELSDTKVRVYIVPDLFIFDLLHARWSSIRGIPAVSIFDSPFYGVGGLLKRAEDLLLGIIIMAVIAVPMIVIATGVKLTSPGPVIFRQRRYGIDGREIIVWKFRTMNVCEDDSQFRQATRNDCRVTSFGRFLRRTSLDELPQFINVLQGRMSVVGPRPHPIALDEQHRKLIDGYMLRSRVKPGITGWAQVNGWRGETDTLEKMKKRVEFDLYYIRNWSVWLDCKIFLLTITRGFLGQNSY